jgi:hypothetical protein
MFSAAEFFELEHTAHSKLFEADKYVWEALKQIPSYLQFRLKPAVLGELVGKPFVSGSVFIGSGTIVEQGAMLKGPAWIGENCSIRSGCYVRENVIVGNNVVMGNSCEFKSCIIFDEAQIPQGAAAISQLRFPGRQALWWLILVIVSFSTLFTAQHYILDIVAGILVAALGYFVSLKWTRFSPAPAAEE